MLEREESACLLVPFLCSLFPVVLGIEFSTFYILEKHEPFSKCPRLKIISGVGEIAQCLRELTALGEDPDSISSTFMTAYSIL